MWRGIVPRILFIAASCVLLISLYLFFPSASLTTTTTQVQSDKDIQQSPKTAVHTTPATTHSDEPVRACFVILVRNRELDGIVSTIRQVEDRFNKKFNYPYVFLNDDDFTEEFKQRTSELTQAETRYGKVDEQMWGYPNYINQTLAAENREEMARLGIPYAESESYRHMCRYDVDFIHVHEDLMRSQNIDSKVDSSSAILSLMTLIGIGVLNLMWITIVIWIMMSSSICVIMARNMVREITSLVAKDTYTCCRLYYCIQRVWSYCSKSLEDCIGL